MEEIRLKQTHAILLNILKSYIINVLETILDTITEGSVHQSFFKSIDNFGNF